MPHVIEWDGDEPFIRVNDEFRLTPYRDPEDTEGMCEISNFPDVGKWSYMRPYPYTVPDARIWFDLTVPSQKAAVALLKANKEEAADVGEVSPASTPTPPLSVIPFIVLRDKTGKYLGDASLTFEDDVWVIAYALNPSLWGKGVGTQMVKTLIEWGEESNGVKEVHAAVVSMDHLGTLWGDNGPVVGNLLYHADRTSGIGDVLHINKHGVQSHALD
ncbi:uncharacterized protein EHS24_002503 [Apiotrichum porosum]|uniref:N-acetyltransferase domain-containing protein n=1 Tax=Apiotrichum porosum TaxID=105984 RepID=A0A427XGR9_9TREE|nr:uncharacterized protein EHS24_002503 [Apiotrichum porosum]RSH78048.1 hypothetical protein EHS24_002503 [Apiotrichum porosum]